MGAGLWHGARRKLSYERSGDQLQGALSSFLGWGHQQLMVTLVDWYRFFFISHFLKRCTARVRVAVSNGGDHEKKRFRTADT